MRKNWLTTVGGILALMGGIPIALGAAHVPMPSWFYVICVSCTVVGPGIVGLAAKGQDESPTQTQVDKATIVAQDKKENA